MRSLLVVAAAACLLAAAIAAVSVALFARGIDPVCPACATGQTNRCHNIAFGHLQPGLQTGFCESTGATFS